MSPRLTPALLLALLFGPTSAQTLPGTIPAFAIERSELGLEQTARPGTYFDKAGRRFAMLGEEGGSFEAWAWPLQLFRDFRLSFFIGSSTTPIEADEIVTTIRVEPAVTTIAYVFQSFTVRAHYVAHPAEPGGVILLDVDSIEPLRIVAGFIPTLNPMWPAGLGGQYAFWDEGLKAYLISESSRRNHGYVGSPAASGMSYTPAHMLSEQPNEFAVVIDDPPSVLDRFIPIVIAGGPGERAAVRAVYDELVADPEAVYRAAADHMESILESSIWIETADHAVERAVKWATVSYDNLLVDNPYFKKPGLTAGFDRAGRGGRPGFGWFFAGDAYINSFSLNALGSLETARAAIDFTELYQRDDGKMPHEVTQALDYVDWFGRYGYAYIHADTSPYFVAAVYDHFLWTADTTWVRERWPSLKRAYDWSRATDGNGDGLMDNSLAGLGALEFGSLTGIETDIYLGAVWVRATDAMRTLARVVGDNRTARMADADFVKASAAFEKFWSGDIGQYSYGFADDGTTVNEVTPWAAVGLMWGYGTDERARSTLARMARSDLTTDWGVRMMSTESSYFEPLNYNYGAVWPFLTSWVATAQFERGLPLQAFSTWRSAVGHVERRALGHVTEVFSGAAHTWPQESVPHQGFCTAATVLPLVRGLLGIRPDAPNGVVTFAPRVPIDWPSVNAWVVRVGKGYLQIWYSNSNDLNRGHMSFRIVPHEGAPSRFSMRPSLPPHSIIESVSVNGANVPFAVERGPQVDVVVFDVDADQADVRIEYRPGFTIAPPTWDTEVGDSNHGLRIARFEAVRDGVEMELEAPAGTTHRIPVAGRHRVARIDSDVEVGYLEQSDIVEVRFPGEGSGYATVHIHVILKDPQ